MRTRFYNARILDVENKKVFEGELHVTDDKITYVGEDEKEVLFDKEIDCQGNLLMPGFKNAHSHSPMTFLRSYCDDTELQTWLFNNVFPLEDQLTAEDVYHLTKLAILEYLSSGITATMDMYLFPFEVAKASSEMGFRNVITGFINYYGDDVKSMIQMYADMNNISPLVTYKIGFHSEYTANPTMLENLSIVTNNLRQPIYTHLSETKKEVDECIARHHLTPIQYFDKLGLLNYGGGFYHCVHLTDTDIELFKKKNLYVVSCPGSNSKLASGIADIKRLYQEGLLIGLGTDGPSSNNSLDTFKEMYLLSVLQKLKHNDPVAIKAEEIVKMATYNSAHIMGLNDADTLKAGKKADIIMIDLAKPSMRPFNNIISNLVYSGSKDIVKMTMIDGKILYQDGQYFVDEDINDIYNKAQEIIDRMKK